jgi:hypothetical protein
VDGQISGAGALRIRAWNSPRRGVGDARLFPRLDDIGAAAPFDAYRSHFDLLVGLLVI